MIDQAVILKSMPAIAGEGNWVLSQQRELKKWLLLPTKPSSVQTTNHSNRV